jgi:hypothetical protein
LVWIAAAGAIWVFASSSMARAQQLQNPPMVVTALDPVGLVTGDWNQDGHQDLIYIATAESPSLHLLLGDGRGGFTDGTSLQLPRGTCTYEVVTCTLIVGDFNKDSHPDILMAGNFPSGWGYLVLPGHGDGTFGTPIISTLPTSSSGGLATLVNAQSVVADFNKDGSLDIAAPDYFDNSINIYLGDGTGKFTPGTDLNDPSRPYAVYSVDTNHDGNADLIVFDQSSSGAAIWLGNGTGGFTYSQTYPTNRGSSTFAPQSAADFTGDGNLDIIGVDGTGKVLVMTGNADGTFNPPQIVASGFEATAPFENNYYAADVTGDGIPDLLGASLEGFETAVATSRMTYGPVQQRTSGPFTTQLAVADFNQDGAPDMAVGVSGGIQFFFGSKQGAFPDSTITPVTEPVTFLFAGDFNEDGVADVAAVGSDNFIRTSLGVKAGGFTPSVKTSTPVTTAFEYIGNTVGDFDGDGQKDILIGGQVLYGNGDGSFTPVSLSTANNGLVADLNQDGRSDLLSLLSLTSGAGSNVYYYGLTSQLGTAKRTLTQVTTDFPPYLPGQGITTPALLGVGGLDGDVYPDAAVYDANLPAIEIWLGKGDGTFHKGTVVSLGKEAWTPLGAGGQGNQIGVGAIVDLDGDGKADLVFLATEKTSVTNLVPVPVLVIEYGDGDGGFDATQVLPLSHAFTFMGPATLDTSGHPGIVVGNSALVSVIRNLGARQYSSEKYDSAGTMTGLLAADFNGDGLSDILALRSNPESSPNTGAPGFTVLLNQSVADGNGEGVANGSLSASPLTVQYNQAFTITGLLAPSVSGAPVPTGTLTFSVSGTPLGSATLKSGSAAVQVSGAVTQSLPPGDLEITANYSGDSFYAPFDLTTVVQVMNPSYPTKTVLTASVGGSPVSSVRAGSFLALLAKVSAPQTVISGYIAFYDGTTILGQVEISNGQAEFSTNLLPIGANNLSAQYLGFSPPNSTQGINIFLASSSPTLPVTVTAIPTTATLTPSASTVTAGAVLTVTAQVNSGNGSPIGAVTFLDGTTALGTQTLDASGSAAFSTVSLLAGKHSITARYNANGIYSGVVSSPASVTVDAASAALMHTLTQITAVTPGSTTEGGLASVQVTGSSTEFGNVSLLVDGQLIATNGVPASGRITFALPGLVAGNHAVFASYSGSALAAPSASPKFMTTAYQSGPDFILQAASTALGTGSSGMSGSIPLTIGAVGDWNRSVTFSCASAVPQGYNCTFAPATLSGVGTTRLTLEPSQGLPAMAILFLPLALLLDSKRRFRTFTVLVLGAALLSLSSCGTASQKTSAKPSIVTVEATSGSSVHSAQFVWKTSSAEE